MVTLTDRELALRTRQGDSAAFGELVRRYQTSVFNICYRLMGERREAEDMTQDAFIRAYQRFDRYNLDRPFGPWMRRVASNYCINRLKTSAAAMDAASYSLEDERDQNRDQQSGAASRPPEARREQVERAEAVRAAILDLPLHYRAVIELRHYQDMSYAQIADQLGVPLSDVKSHLFRARKQLEQKLRSYVS